MTANRISGGNLLHPKPSVFQKFQYATITLKAGITVRQLNEASIFKRQKRLRL
jgi:hypothetical protein